MAQAAREAHAADELAEGACLFGDIGTKPLHAPDNLPHNPEAMARRQLYPVATRDVTRSRCVKLTVMPDDPDDVEPPDDAEDDDVEPRGLDDDSGYGPDSYFAHAMDKDN